MVSYVLFVFFLKFLLFITNLFVNFKKRIKNRKYLIDAFHLNPIFLQHEFQNQAPDFRDWCVPFGRRFRSLKLWFVLRLFGIKGLQDHIRHVKIKF